MAQPKINYCRSNNFTFLSSTINMLTFYLSKSHWSVGHTGANMKTHISAETGWICMCETPWKAKCKFCLFCNITNNCYSNTLSGYKDFKRSSNSSKMTNEITNKRWSTPYDTTISKTSNKKENKCWTTSRVHTKIVRTLLVLIFQWPQRPQTNSKGFLFWFSLLSVMFEPNKIVYLVIVLPKPN